jgi:hypothetical protein
MNLIGELPRQFIADLREDPTRMKNRAWDMYSEEVRKACNWFEIRWMKAEIEKLQKEYVKTLGAVLKLDEEAAREMMFPSTGRAQVPLAQSAQAMAQAAQSQLMAQAYANHQGGMNGKGGGYSAPMPPPPTYSTSTTTGKI